MPESAEGRVVDIKKDGDIEISCPEGRDWPTGTKLSILDADGDAVVEVRVVDGDASVVTARYFVPWDAASSAASLIGAAIIPGVGGAIGGALGRVIGAAGKRRGTGARIHEGMKVVEAPERTANPSPGPAPSPDEGGGCPPKPQSTGELRMVWARQRAVTANEHFSSGRAPARVEYSRYWRDARTGQIRPQLGVRGRRSALPAGPGRACRGR
jgi:hypothetical protein